MRKFFLQTLNLLALLLALTAWVVLPPAGDLMLLGVFAIWLTTTVAGRQAARLAWIGLRSIRSRLGSASVIVVGIACVTAVVASLLAMGSGFADTMRSGGREDTVIVLRGGSASESQSILLRSDIDALSQLPGIAKDANGRLMLSPELVVAANLSGKKDSDQPDSIQLRGVDPMSWELRPGLHIVQGRAFHPGTRELVVGDGVRSQHPELRIGQEIHLGTKPWRIVGAFHSGDAYDSELWADRVVIADDYRRGDTVESVLLRLVSPSRLDALNAAIDANPSLRVETDTTRGFFARQAGNLTAMVQAVSLSVGAIMALGAAFGALNCMFAAVAARVREIATLRAIGFRGGSMVVAVMVESMLLAVLGGCAGAAVAWLCFNGYTTSTLNGFNQVVFSFRVSADVLASALKWALAIGVVGGLYPGLRSARLSVAQSLRDA